MSRKRARRAHPTAQIGPGFDAAGVRAGFRRPSWGGKCITNKGGSMGDGAYLALWTCSNSRIPEQEWSV
ncbi:RICIN domain-containing protein [Kitasatospora sp. NPDC089913]|uniref:RICIN domain-containing protein n=1 Tax=Kitasatospora sp. NPDC089913 TaxID=3364080 RepID=UPI0038126CC9